MYCKSDTGKVKTFDIPIGGRNINLSVYIITGGGGIGWLRSEYICIYQKVLYMYVDILATCFFFHSAAAAAAGNRMTSP